jgi:hypothetical protein
MSEFDMPPEDIAKRLTVDQRIKRVGEETGLTPRQANAITKARLQYALSELADMNIDNVNRWLNQVGERSPAEAIRLYMELMEFSTPRLKAAQVVANLTPNADGQRKLNEMSIEELQRIVAEG